MATQDMFSVRDALAGAEFSGRVNDVFANLGSGQIKHDSKDVERDDVPDFEKQQIERSIKTHKSVIKNEVQFKRPKTVDSNTKGRTRVPGWKKNPSGYKKYSLSDVPDMTSGSNTAAAFDFLNKLRKEKEEIETPADLNQRVIFKKKSIKNRNEEKDCLDDDGGSVLATGENITEKKMKKKSKKESRPTLSFDEEEEDGE